MPCPFNFGAVHMIELAPKRIGEGEPVHDISRRAALQADEPRLGA